MVAAAVGHAGATYPAGARPGRAGAERVDPEPEPERGGRPLSPSARRFLCGRAAPPAGPEGGGAPAAPPSSARPPRPLLLPASIPATCQLGGRRRLRGHAPKGLAPAPGLRIPGPVVSQEERRRLLVSGTGPLRSHGPLGAAHQPSEKELRLEMSRRVAVAAETTGLEHRPRRTPRKAAEGAGTRLTASGAERT